MPRKPPTTPPSLTRASRRAYQKAVADAGERVARLRGAPEALERQARERAFAEIGRRVATTPTQKQKKAVAFLKNAVRRD